jgi:hypothetical protein
VGVYVFEFKVEAVDAAGVAIVGRVNRARVTITVLPSPITVRYLYGPRTHVLTTLGMESLVLDVSTSINPNGNAVLSGSWACQMKLSSLNCFSAGSVTLSKNGLVNTVAFGGLVNVAGDPMVWTVTVTAADSTTTSKSVEILVTNRAGPTVVVKSTNNGVEFSNRDTLSLTGGNVRFTASVVQSCPLCTFTYVWAGPLDFSSSTSTGVLSAQHLRAFQAGKTYTYTVTVTVTSNSAPSVGTATVSFTWASSPSSGSCGGPNTAVLDSPTSLFCSNWQQAARFTPLTYSFQVCADVQCALEGRVELVPFVAESTSTVDLPYRGASVALNILATIKDTQGGQTSTMFAVTPLLPTGITATDLATARQSLCLPRANGNPWRYSACIYQVITLQQSSTAGAGRRLLTVTPLTLLNNLKDSMTLIRTRDIINNGLVSAQAIIGTTPGAQHLITQFRTDAATFVRDSAVAAVVVTGGASQIDAVVTTNLLVTFELLLASFDAAFTVTPTNAALLSEGSALAKLLTETIQIASKAMLRTAVAGEPAQVFAAGPSLSVSARRVATGQLLTTSLVMGSTTVTVPAGTTSASAYVDTVLWVRTIGNVNAFSFASSAAIDTSSLSTHSQAVYLFDAQGAALASARVTAIMPISAPGANNEGQCRRYTGALWSTSGCSATSTVSLLTTCTCNSMQPIQVVRKNINSSISPTRTPTVSTKAPTTLAPSMSPATTAPSKAPTTKAPTTHAPTGCASCVDATWCAGFNTASSILQLCTSGSTASLATQCRATCGACAPCGKAISTFQPTAPPQTIPITDSPTAPPPGCLQGDDATWKGPYGDMCPLYASNPNWCTDVGAQQKCCSSCPVPTVTPPVPGCPQGDDTTWTGPYGDFCTGYATHPTWCSDPDAATKCCKSCPITSTIPASSTCTADDANFVGPYGDRCTDYSVNPQWCKDANASTMCCKSCGVQDGCTDSPTFFGPYGDRCEFYANFPGYCIDAGAVANCCASCGNV